MGWNSHEFGFLRVGGIKKYNALGGEIWADFAFSRGFEQSIIQKCKNDCPGDVRNDSRVPGRMLLPARMTQEFIILTLLRMYSVYYKPVKYQLPRK